MKLSARENRSSLTFTDMPGSLLVQCSPRNERWKARYGTPNLHNGPSSQERPGGAAGILEVERHEGQLRPVVSRGERHGPAACRTAARGTGKRIESGPRPPPDAPGPRGWSRRESLRDLHR